MNRLENACEEVDASVFSSDMMFDPEQYAMFKEYLGRWNRAVEEHEKGEALEQHKEPEQEPVAWMSPSWVGLTDEEAQWLYDNCRTPSNLIDMTEAKLKEKNT